ncbi:MAG: methyltransferase domain-containing protein [Thermoleophilia bacterium]
MSTSIEGPVSTEEAARLVAECPRWHHSMEVVPGVRSNGNYDPQPMLDRMGLPLDMTGMRALDIGANDGFFSFEMERRGAEVVAIDCGEPAPGFVLTHRLRNSSVAQVDRNVYELTPEHLGTFDVILFLGVLYHLRHPLLALDVLHRLANPGAALFVETHAIDQALIGPGGAVYAMGDPTYQLMQFYPMGELGGDESNWWAPTLTCLESMVETALFRVKWGVLWNSARALVKAVRDPELERRFYPHDRGIIGDTATYFPPFD